MLEKKEKDFTLRNFVNNYTISDGNHLNKERQF